MFFKVFGERPPAVVHVREPEIVLRAELPKSKWDLISDDVRAEFNRRLKAERTISDESGTLGLMPVKIVSASSARTSFATPRDL